VRQALYLSAMETLNARMENSLSAVHNRLCSEGKHGKAEPGAVMRKQLTVMRAVIISGKPYDPNHQHRGNHSAQPVQKKRDQVLTSNRLSLGYERPSSDFRKSCDFK